MIKTLHQYILNDNGCQDIENLIMQNGQFKDDIIVLEQKLKKVELGRYKSINTNRDQLEQILSTLRKSEDDLLQQQKILHEQSKQITSLIVYVEKYLSQEGSQPRTLESKIKYLKVLVSSAHDNNCPKLLIDKMERWNIKMVEILEKKLLELVGAFSTHIRIRMDEIGCYKDLLNQQVCQEFVKMLYRNVLVYDVPSSSYQLLVPKKESKSNGIVFVERECVLFTCQQAEKNYSYLLKAIQETERLAVLICQQVGEEQQYCEIMRNQIKNSQQDLKAIIQYILPYLGLDKRKKLMQLLSTKSQSQASLYDILVSMKFKGQDGQMLESNVEQIVLKVTNQPSLVKEVEAFFQICANQQLLLNVGLYVCNELSSRLEGLIEYEEIEKLLTLREQIRYKMHHI